MSTVPGAYLACQSNAANNFTAPLSARTSSLHSPPSALTRACIWAIRFLELGLDLLWEPSFKAKGGLTLPALRITWVGRDIAFWPFFGHQGS